MSDKCTYFRSAYSNCPNDASLEVGGESLCKECAAIEKGRLEAVEEALQRNLSDVRKRIKSLKVKSTPCVESYHVTMKAGLGEDWI